MARVTAPSTPALARCHGVKAARIDGHREVLSIAVLNSSGKLVSPPRWTRCFEVPRMALVVSVMLASFQLLAKEGTSRGTPDIFSHGTDRWSRHLLQKGRPERRANASPAARTSVFIADVRALFARLSDRYHLVAPDYPRFRHSAHSFHKTAEVTGVEDAKAVLFNPAQREIQN